MSTDKVLREKARRTDNNLKWLELTNGFKFMRDPKKNNLKKHSIIEISELIKSKLKSIETFSDVKIIDTIN